MAVPNESHVSPHLEGVPVEAHKVPPQLNPANESQDWGNWSGRKTHTDTLEEEMIAGLQQVPWRKVVRAPFMEEDRSVDLKAGIDEHLSLMTNCALRRSPAPVSLLWKSPEKPVGRVDESLPSLFQSLYAAVKTKERRKVRLEGVVDVCAKLSRGFHAGVRRLNHLTLLCTPTRPF